MPEFKFSILFDTSLVQLHCKSLTCAQDGFALGMNQGCAVERAVYRTFVPFVAEAGREQQMGQEIAGKERPVLCLRQLNAALRSWIPSLRLSESLGMSGKSLTLCFLVPITNYVFLLYWMPHLRPWGLTCRSAEHAQLQLAPLRAVLKHMKYYVMLRTLRKYHAVGVANQAPKISSHFLTLRSLCLSYPSVTWG